jgi:hypothetical protein
MPTNYLLDLEQIIALIHEGTALFRVDAEKIIKLTTHSTTNHLISIVYAVYCFNK